MDITLQPGERIDQLYSQQIGIIQSPAVFAFSLDAVLLADFARIPRRPNQHIVDLCAGNGAVSLFMSHRTQAKITAVELQPRLADMAQRSVRLNDLSQQIDVVEGDLANLTNWVPKDSVDAVTVNPPYFADLPTSKKNPNQYLAIARHEITTSLSAVIQASSDVLKMMGKLSMVHRPDRLAEIITIMAAHRLAPKRLRFVYPKTGEDANIVLIEAIKDGQSTGITVLPPLLTYHSDGQYTDEMRRLLYGDNDEPT